MGIKTWGTTIVATMIVGVLFSSNAMASTDHVSEIKSLVALGDSITYGYNLGKNNEYPSSYAYPYLLGIGEGYRVDDLAVPGATSTDLLNELTEPGYQKALSHADVITVDIGSNDLLSLAEKDGLFSTTPPVLTLGELFEFDSAIAQYSKNLPMIIKKVKETANPQAKIILYNLYDPIPSTNIDPTLFTISETLLGAENSLVSSVSSQYKIPLADAYHVFRDNPLRFVRIAENDVHPTVAGQQALAQLGENIINDKIRK